MRDLLRRSIGWLRAGLLGASLVLSAWILWFGGAVPLSDLLSGNRATLYSTLAQICASLMGLIITAVSVILLYATNGRLSLVSSHGRFPELVRVFLQTIASLGVAALLSLVALVGDKEKSPAPLLFCLCLIALAWVAGNVVRCLLLFDRIVDLVTGPSRAKTGGNG